MNEQIRGTGSPFSAPVPNSTPAKEEVFSPSPVEIDIHKWSETLEQLDRRLSVTEQKLTTVNTNANNLTEKVKEQQHDYSELRQKIIEWLGLFVAFITFVSANVTVFSRVEHVSMAILFMGLMLLCMLCFLYAFFIVMEPKSKMIKDGLLPVIKNVALIVAVTCLVFWIFEKELVSIVKKVGKEKSICINCIMDEQGKMCKSQPRLEPSNKM